MLTILLTVQIVVTVIMIVTILMQKNSNDGLGGLGGGGQPSLSVDNGSTLSKITGWLAAIFMANSLLMAVVASSSTSREDAILEELIKTRLPSDAAQEAPVAPEKNDEKQETDDQPVSVEEDSSVTITPNVPEETPPQSQTDETKTTN